MFNFFNDNNKDAVKKDYAVGSFDKVNIDVPSCNVEFKVAEKYAVHYLGAEKLIPEVKVENKRLNITYKTHDQHIVVNVFNLKKLAPKLVIEIPKKELESLDIDLANGNVHADYLAVKSGSLDLSNGNVTIDELYTQKGMDVDLANGNVAIKKTNATGYDLSTSLGKVVYKGQKQGHDFELNSDNKNVIEVDTAKGNISIK
ncbi:DUF4097 family beta strand repeat-containing protein [uncultured Lactobacillus sp.]|uniref:DUF4097 family beta strand repeat-containing protein n=1 Tax=uncultured Lactobacillus sp. TaxID=153152 RepID=UPI0026090384|nr:DUF4097 family beta strand repeat-containing protein [uncultured Lactobacillus sp.]